MFCPPVALVVPVAFELAAIEPPSFGSFSDAYPAMPSFSLSSSSCARRYAIGTSSMSRKSKHELARKVALGSEAL